ncbi:MAG: permease [Hydrogenophaga sp.]|nr:permease [Hydrogenophaga sp.]
MPETPVQESPSLSALAPSRLARLQQWAVCVALAAALGWGLWVWPHSPAAALAGVALLLGGYALVLALELVAVARVHGADPAPRPRWADLARAWWQEVRMAPRVFAWRQPFVWRRWPDTLTAPACSARGAGAVVFVHGFVCNRGFWHPWMRELRRLGVPYVSVNLEPVFGSIDDYVPLMEQAVCRAEALGGLPPQLVCHSMGGLAARAWLVADVANPARVQRVLSIGTPHHGTWLGQFSHLPNGRQMRMHSPWLQALAAAEAQHAPEATYRQFICWYANTDNIVFPASTATLPGADNRLVPGAAHVAMAFHPRVMRESLALLASGASSPCAATAV